jgi:hypothetical protein
LCDVYNLISWCDFVGVNGIVLFVYSIAKPVTNSAIRVVFIICLLDICCWFGDVAVK